MARIVDDFGDFIRKGAATFLNPLQEDKEEIAFQEGAKDFVRGYNDIWNELFPYMMDARANGRQNDFLEINRLEFWYLVGYYEVLTAGEWADEDGIPRRLEDILKDKDHHGSGDRHTK